MLNIFITLTLLFAFGEVHALEIYDANGESVTREEFNVSKGLDVMNFKKIAFVAKKNLTSQTKEYFKYFQEGVVTEAPKNGVYCQIAFDFAGTLYKTNSLDSFEILPGDKHSYDRLIKFWGDGSFINSIHCSANHKNRQVSILELEQALFSQFEVVGQLL